MATEVERLLAASGVAAYVVDRDVVRQDLSAELGFSPRTATRTSAASAPWRASSPTPGSSRCARRAVRRGPRLRARRARAPRPALHRGVGRHARRGADARTATRRGSTRRRAAAVPDFTGVSAPYEPPRAAELVLDGAGTSVPRTPSACSRRCAPPSIAARVLSCGSRSFGSAARRRLEERPPGCRSCRRSPRRASGAASSGVVLRGEDREHLVVEAVPEERLRRVEPVAQVGQRRRRRLRRATRPDAVDVAVVRKKTGSLGDDDGNMSPPTNTWTRLCRWGDAAAGSSPPAGAKPRRSGAPVGGVVGTSGRARRARPAPLAHPRKARSGC